MKPVKIVILFLICFHCYICNGQDTAQLVITTGHHSRINSFSFSNNGRYVVSAEDNIVKIYDLIMQLEFNSLPPFSRLIKQVKFSSDNNYIFVLGTDEIFTISHPGGEILNHVKVPGYVGSKEEVFIAPNDKIYISSEWGGLTVYDPVKGIVEKVWKNIKFINVVYLSKQNILMGRQKDPTDKKKYNLNLVNASTGELIKSISMPGGKYGKVFITSKDEELVAIEIDSGRINIFNTKTFSFVSQIIFPQGSLSALEFYKDKKHIIGSSHDGRLYVFDVASGKEIQKIKTETLNGTTIKANPDFATAVYDLEISPDGKTLAVPLEHGSVLTSGDFYHTFRIGYYNLSDMKLKHKYDGQHKTFRSLIINQDESKMITMNVASPARSLIWDLKKGEVEWVHNGIMELKLGGDRLVMDYFEKEGNKHSIRIFEFSTMKLITEIETKNYTRFEISPDGKYIAGMLWAGGASEANHVIWEGETGKVLYSTKCEPDHMNDRFCFSKADLFLLYKKHNYDTTNVLCIDPEKGKLLRSVTMLEGSNNNSFIEFDQSGQEIFYRSSSKYNEKNRFFDIRSKNLFTDSITTYIHEEINGSTTLIKFSPDNTRMAMFVWDFNSSKVYKVYVYDWKTKKKIKVLEDFKFPIYSMAFGPKTGNLYLGDENGVVTIIGDDYERKASLLTENERDYIIISPDNYYKTSVTNTQGMGFRYKNELYRFDQFDLRYNRPDIALKPIGLASETQLGLYKDAWLKRLARLGFNEEIVNTNSIHAPQIMVVEKENLPYNTIAGSIKFKVNTSDSLYELKQIAVYVNNVPLYGKNGFNIPTKGTNKFSKEIELALEEGKNKISVSVFNSIGVESTRESFTVECTKKFTKPDLYIFAIGVSKYKDTTMNLTYSDKDVKDIASLFTEKNKINMRFANVYVKLLTNEEATVANVETAAAFLKKAKTNDQVILFYSGHGLIDQNLDYYLAMHNVDFTNPSLSGLSYTHFQDFLDGLQCRKRLLLIDACHSGEFDKEDYTSPTLASNSDEQYTIEKEIQFRGKKVVGIGNANELMKELFADLRKETGATIIASSSGAEYSVESPTWKNGVFTYALKEAFSDMKADRNKDKEITLIETREYLVRKVKELTRGKQNPTTRQENIEFDYRIW